MQRSDRERNGALPEGRFATRNGGIRIRIETKYFSTPLRTGDLRIMPPAQDSRVPILNLDGVLAALGIAADGAQSQVPYTVLRGREGPRWLIPDRSPLVRTILSEWRPYGLLARLSWVAVPMASRLGVLPLLPGAARALLPSNACSQFMSHIGRHFDAGLPLILVGNSIATRKLLVFLEERSPKRNVLVKVPFTRMAQTSILNEARVLDKMNGRLRTPRLLYLNEDAGVAMQEYLPGRLGSRRCKPEYLQFLLELVETGERISLRVQGLRLAERLNKCPAYTENASRVDSALTLLDQDVALAPALVHGDFAPWNIRELPDGACTLIDWEATRPHGLPLHDLCHFYYMQTLLFAPQKLFYVDLLRDGAWAAYCSRLDIPASLLKPLAAAFLLEMLAGYWEIPETSVDWFCLHQLKLLLEFVGN
jgi:hypothetical protein